MECSQCSLCLESSNEQVIEPCDCSFYKVHKSCLPQQTLYCRRCNVHYNSDGRVNIQCVDNANVTSFEEFQADLQQRLHIAGQATIRELEAKFEVSEELRQFIEEFFCCP